MVLVCNKPESVIQVIDGLTLQDDPVRHMRLIRLHGRHAVDREQLFASEQWKTAVKTISSYAPDPELEFDLT